MMQGMNKAGRRCRHEKERVNMGFSVDQWLEKSKKDEQKMREKDQKAKAQGKLVGRYVREHVADGYAFYEIIRENKQTVRIRVVTGVGDGWRVSFWGDEATIAKDYALKNIGFRDRLANAINKSKK